MQEGSSGEAPLKWGAPFLSPKHQGQELTTAATVVMLGRVSRARLYLVMRADPFFKCKQDNR